MNISKGLTLAAAMAVFSLSTVSFAQVDDSILSDEYITTQEFIEAEVVQVRPVSRTLTVRGEKRGQTRQFTVPVGTRISVNGRDAYLRDIRKGDKVLLAMTPQQEKVVVARLRVPQSDQTLEQRRADPIVAEATPATLPKTASQWPTVLAFGLLALLGASALRLRNSA